MKPKKRYGQNFLISEAIIKKIVELENLYGQIIFEIGPGKGVLTNELVKVAKHVVAFEIDYTLSLFLDFIQDKTDNLEIIYGDVLEVDFDKLIEKRDYSNVFCVANIPYYITGLLLKKIRKTEKISTAILMLQKEVGARILSNPGNKKYGSLTVITNYFFDVKKVCDVKRTHFYPAPKVDSVVLKFKRYDKYRQLVKDEKFFLEFVSAAFNQKRKTLLNNLRSYYNMQTEEVLKKLSNIESEFNKLERAENIDIMRLINFANGWNND